MTEQELNQTTQAMLELFGKLSEISDRPGTSDIERVSVRILAGLSNVSAGLFAIAAAIRANKT